MKNYLKVMRSKKMNRRLFQVLTFGIITCLIISCKNDRSEEIPLSNVWEHRKYQIEILYKDESDSSFLQKNYKKLYESNINDPNAFYLYRRLLNAKNEETNHLDSLLLSKFTKYQKNPFILYLLAEYYYKIDYLIDAENYSNKAIILDNNCHLTYKTLGYISLKKAEQVNSGEDKVLLAKKSIYYFKKFKTGKFSQKNDIEFANSSIEYLQEAIAQEEEKLAKEEKRLAKCKGHEEDLRTYELSKLIRFPGIYFDKIHIYYLGNCHYRATTEIKDLYYNSTTIRSIEYLWEENGFWKDLTNGSNN
jgi:hypothetical protein